LRIRAETESQALEQATREIADAGGDAGKIEEVRVVGTD
jgi:hypothetical protein